MPGTLNDSYIAGDHVVNARCLLNADCIDQVFYIAPCSMKVVRIDYIHGTAGSDGSAVNLQVRRCQGTETPTQGDALLTNNSSAGFNCKGTAWTVQNGTLTTDTSVLTLSAGDRLSLDFTGTVTALVDVTVTVTLQRV